MKFTKKWKKKHNPCKEAVDWFYAQKERDVIKVLEKLIVEDRLDWANWAIVRCMTYKQYVSYAVYAAELVIDIYEKVYPNDKCPRLAIEAAKKCIKSPTKKNKAAARAAWAAGAAGTARAVWVAEAAARAAGTARAAWVAEAAARAAWAAGTAEAAWAAGAAWEVARKEIRLTILCYGLRLLK